MSSVVKWPGCTPLAIRPSAQDFMPGRAASRAAAVSRNISGPQDTAGHDRAGVVAMDPRCSSTTSSRGSLAPPTKPGLWPAWTVGTLSVHVWPGPPVR